MPQATDKLIRLLIVDESLHQAEIITTALRSAGLHVLAEYAEESEDIKKIISGKALDLVLFSLELPDISMQQVQNLIRECGRHLYTIGMAQKFSEEMALEMMKQGAQDVVSFSSLERLALVVQREAGNIKTWRQTVKTEKELHESEKRCQSLLANSKDAVAYVHEGMHIYANEAYLELFGHTDFDEIEGVPLIDMIESKQRDELKQFLRDFSQNKNTRNQLELKMLHSADETLDALLEFSRASYEGELCTQILIRLQQDTSELEQQINYMRQHDLITGLYNRQYFLDDLQQRIDNAANGESLSFFLYMLIDNFHSIQTNIGISGCDILINDIAKILKQEFFSNELIARFGAHTFGILCTGREKEVVESNARNLLKKIEHHISETGPQSISCTCSIAIYSIDENTHANPNEIVSRVDRTLDRIQANGGNDLMFYKPVAGEMTEQEQDNEIIKHIKAAVAKNNITALYQPIVSINGVTGERYEILPLIETADGGLLYKKDFLATAVRTGMAGTLDRWAIITAIKQISDSLKSDRKLDIFIPLSIDGLKDHTLPRWVSARILSAKIPGEQLVFSISEAHAVNHLKAVKSLFKSLKKIHCKVVLDDFGTGLNPFQLVKLIQPDFLRINTALVEGLATNTHNQDSIHEITTQAANMQINSILPSVSDAAMLSVLWKVGADFVQGEFLQGPAESLNYDFSSMSG